ncbi:MAG: FHA domain-containing protein, partial [Actinobacteria bacterium]|nr:FHA domain-containing protein [Actinomycetota bacterium]
DPEARSCAVCGAGISRRSGAPEPGPRPPLGVLVLEDGTAYDLDGDYVVGREPVRDAAVSAGDARPLRVIDAESTVSRVHARVHLDGWQVLLTDLGSANGTRIRVPGSKGEQPLDPQVPVRIVPGTRVFVGAQGLSFEPYHDG